YPLVTGVQTCALPIYEPRDVALDSHQLVTHGAEVGEGVLVHLRPLRFVVFADLVPQLGLRETFCRRLFFLLELAQGLLPLRDERSEGRRVGVACGASW